MPVEELRNYTRIQVEVVRAQFFDPSNSHETRVLLSYGGQKKETEFREDHTWHFKIQFAIQPELHTGRVLEEEADLLD